MKPTRTWCNTERTHLGCYMHLPKRVRCVDCGRLLKTIVKGCGDYNCWHTYLPAHKGKFKCPKQKENGVHKNVYGLNQK